MPLEPLKALRALKALKILKLYSFKLDPMFEIGKDG